MLARVLSHGLNGISGFPVEIEADITTGLPAYDTVGLPDAAVRESKERIRAALKNSGFTFPVAHITVNLAPAGMKKEGAVYDLPIAVALLIATGELQPSSADDYCIFGELALDGSVRPITGVLPMVIDARSTGIKRFIVPAGNAEETSYLSDVEIYPVHTLAELKDHFSGKARLDPVPLRKWTPTELTFSSDFSEIKGQQTAKRAAEIAVAGGHNLLMVGTPGSGKTMLARSIPSILPELTLEESLEITKIHSVAGTTREHGIILERPFRAPHHGASSAALVGGGQRALPGEISMAHYGVLFLDELPEFKRDVLEALRQPLEDGLVTISRANASVCYPADFMLVAAMNPCPCGNYGSATMPCTCSVSAINRYRSRISGPLMDRIDIQIEMPEVGYKELTEKATGEPSSVIRARVNAARQRQRKRFEKDGILMNSQMRSAQIKKYCSPDPESEKLLREAYKQMHLSARAYLRILKVARTIADVEGSDAILPEHYAEAIQYRSTDGSEA